MKVIKIVFLYLLLVSTCVIAQNTEKSKDVTTFLGIPVDGTKNEMIQKLKNKGFTYDAKYDRLEGEFNGQKVNIYIVTNNNKVYRIMVADANYIDEAGIKIRFNNLCYQFENNPKYICGIDPTIPDKENISYEMIVNNKRYDATFTQISKEFMDNIGIKMSLGELLQDGHKYVDTKTGKVIVDAEEIVENKLVWFTIKRYNSGKYGIMIFYDNGYNKANGEDL